MKTAYQVLSENWETAIEFDGKPHIKEIDCIEAMKEYARQALMEQRRECAKRVDKLHDDAYSYCINTKLIDLE